MPPHSPDYSYPNTIDSRTERHSKSPSSAPITGTHILCGRSIRIPSTITKACRASNNDTETPYPIVSRKVRRPRRSVRFEKEVDIFEIPNVRELPSGHLMEMYMTREEMASIQGEAWDIVELMNLGIDYLEDDTFSKRGLVDLKDDNVEKRRRVREQAYKVVFGIQAFRSKGDSPEENTGYSVEVMADLYSQVSAMAQRMARRVAIYDAMAAGVA